jgi:pimeloyl-ACP methyl ester carboxylesterase
MSVASARAAPASSGSSVPRPIATLIERFDADVFDAGSGRVRIRLAVGDEAACDVVASNGALTVGRPWRRPDALLSADLKTWSEIAADAASGLRAFGAGRLSVRRNLHAGIAFLAATSGATGPGRLRFRTVATSVGSLSLMERGTGTPMLALHGLGGTKVSFLTTVAALSSGFRAIAVDLPGFGDSDKPIGAAYDARYFADAVAELLDALSLPRAHLIGNSLGGRVALEVGLRHPGRARRLALLAPSLAWRRGRPGLSLLRLTRPELGLVQLAPRPLVEAVMHRLIPGADEGWAAAGVDEFLRAYLTPSGRAALYAAARHIYIEEAHGEQGFWTRLPTLRADALFVWGRRDRLVPLAFERHVAEALPGAQHLELDCGHVPQIERPRQTHAALSAFLGAASARAPASARRAAR